MESRVIAVIGAALLGMGAFLPAVGMPPLGSVSYFDQSHGDGMILLVLAFGAGLFGFAGLTKHVIWPGLGALVLLGYFYFHFQSRMDELQQGIQTQLPSGELRDFAEKAMSAIGIQWGFAVMAAASLVLICAGIAAAMRPPEPKW